MNDFLDLPSEIRDTILLWALSLFIAGFMSATLLWVCLDYSTSYRLRNKGKGRYKLPCHAWLAVAPWVLVQSPWVVFLALVAVGALLIFWMGVATMSATQDRAAEEEGQAWESRKAKAEIGNGPETAARWGQRALPEQSFTGVDPL